MIKEEDKGWRAFVCLLLIAPLVYFDGYVVARLWQWHAVPFGLPPVSIGHAVGLSMIVNVIRYRPTAPKDPDCDGLSAALNTAFVLALSLWIGWFAS